MIQEQTVAILGVLKVAYLNSYNHLTKNDAENLINLWTQQFANDDYNLVYAAVQAYIAKDTSGFPPTIGQVREKMRLIAAPVRMTAGEAWHLIQETAANTWKSPALAFKSLPHELQSLVGSWENLCDISEASGSTLSVMKSQFIRDYEARETRNEELDALPEAAKQYRAAMLSQPPADKIKQLNA